MTFSTFARGEVVFEGYYKIEGGGSHIGFSVLREEFDPKTNIWTIRNYVHTADRSHKLHEVTTVSQHDQFFRPLKSEYLEAEGEDDFVVTNVTIRVKGKSFTAKGQIGSPKKNELKGKLDENEVFRNVISRALLINHPANGRVFSYRVLNHDWPLHRSGVARVLDEKVSQGQKVYQILENSDSYMQEIWITGNGQILLTRHPGSNFVAKLVSMEEAIKDQKFSRNSLTKIFFEVPEGKKNVIVKHDVIFDFGLFKAKFDTGENQFKGAVPIRLAK